MNWIEYGPVCRLTEGRNVYGRVLHRYWENVYEASCLGRDLGQFWSSDAAMTAVERELSDKR